MDDEERLLTVRDIARRVGRSEETVRRWIWSGKLPARKLGNQLFVSEKDVASLDYPRVSDVRAEYGASRRARRRPGKGKAESADTNRLFEKYGYSPWLEDLRQHRGQILPGKEQAWRDMEDDERFQDEMLRRYGPVDVSRIFKELREEKVT